MSFKPWEVLRAAIHVIARAGRPILKLLGVKGGTVAGKVQEGAEIIDPLLPSSPPAPREKR